MPSVHDAYKKQSANMHNQQFRKAKPDPPATWRLSIKKVELPLYCMHVLSVLYVHRCSLQL